MGWSDFLNNIVRIKKTNITSLKNVSDEFNPENIQTESPTADKDKQEKYDSVKNEVGYINSGIDKLREILASNNKELSDLTNINNNISDFFNFLFNDEDLVNESVKIDENNTRNMDYGITEQKLKIIELFSHIFSKYDVNTVNSLIVKLINNGKDSPLFQDVKKIIKDWRSQHSEEKGLIKLKCYDNKEVFAEKIIEESEKYDISKEYKKGMRKKEEKEITIKEYSVKGFDLKGDDLMTMFLTNPIVEKLMIDPIIISIHRTKDAISDIGSGILSNIKEQNDYYNNYTSAILDMFTNKNIQNALRSNLTEPALDQDGNPILDDQNNPKTQYDVFLSKINQINSSKFKFRKNKMLKDLLENSSFYLRTKVYRKDAIDEEDPNIDKEFEGKFGHKYDSNNPDDVYKLFELNCIKRSVNIFSEEFAEILLCSTKNCKNKQEAIDIKNTVYTIGAMDPDLIGETEEKIKEVLSFRKKMIDHDYKKKYNTPLEQKYVKDMEKKINKDYAYELENMTAIENEITNIGKMVKERQLMRKSKRIESNEEFINKISMFIDNFRKNKHSDKHEEGKTRLQEEDIETVEKLIAEYKNLYSEVSKHNKSYNMYSEFIKKNAGRTR